MVCSICGSKGVNKSSCPLYVKILLKKKLGTNILEQIEKTQKNKKIVKHKEKLLANPYVSKKNKICAVSERIINDLRNKSSIVLTGHILTHYGIKLRNVIIFKIH